MAFIPRSRVLSLLFALLLLSVIYISPWGPRGTASGLPIPVATHITLTPLDGVSLPFPKDFGNSSDPNNQLGINFVYSIEPQVYCATEERVAVGLDGGKWMCHPRILFTRPEERCVVYSFGCNADVSFELELLKISPECEIHIFDPTPGLKDKISQMNLPEQLHFHGDYGLAAAGVTEVKIGIPVPVKPLGTIMKELGHTFLHQLKIDVEKSELTHGFVDTSPLSPWRNVATLQLEIHPFNPDERMLTISLLKDLEKVGFKIFHNEPNYLHPFLTEVSFLNPTVMEKYTDIHYSEAQIYSARDESVRRIQDYHEIFSFRLMLNMFAKVEKTHFGCQLVRNIPLQQRRTFCESFLTLPGPRPVVYIFHSSLRQPVRTWIMHFASKYNLELHLWSGADSLEGVTAHPLSEIGNSPTLLTTGIPELMKQNLHTEVAMIILSTEDALATAFSAVNGTAIGGFLSSSRAFSRPLQLVLDLCLCEDETKQSEEMKVVVEKLPQAGFSLLGKGLLEESSYDAAKNCRFTFTFSN